MWWLVTQVSTHYNFLYIGYIIEKYTSIRIGELILFQIPGKENPMPQVYRCMDFKQQIADYFKNKK